tara:strand:+ start:57776 stop:62278 length:4503 start_codon:yes stop_codon:yes gene_type:complete
MKKKGLMEDNRNVPAAKLEDFVNETLRLTEYAKKNKGVNIGLLFEIESKTIERKGKEATRSINRAIPNTAAFEAIEAFNKKYNKDNLKLVPAPKRGDSNYDISLNDRLIGDFDLLKNDDNKWVIDLVVLVDEFKGKGLGKQSYILANSLIPKGEGTLHSSGYFEGNEAKKVWKSLVKTGEAEQIGKEEWRFVKSKKNNQTFEKRIEEQQALKKTYKEFLFNNSDLSIAPSDDLTQEEVNENKNQVLNKLFNGSYKPITANEWLRNLFNNPDIDLNKEAQRLIKAALPTRAKIKWVTSAALKNGEETYAEYDSLTRTIRINKDTVGDANLYYAIESVLHEIVHDMTVNSLNQAKSDKQKQFRNDMQEAFTYYSNAAEYSDLYNDNYGFTSVEEFVAEIMTNKAFRNKLKQVQGDRNVFQRILDAIKQFFGLREEQYQPMKVQEIVDSVIDIASEEYQTNEESPLNKVFEKKIKTEKEIKSDLKKDLTNVKDLLAVMYNNLENVRKKSASVKGDTYKEKYDAIQNQIKQLEKASAKKAIIYFIELSKDELNTLYGSLKNKKNPSTDYLSRMKSYMSVFSNTEQIREILENLNRYGDLEQKEYRDLSYALDGVSSKYENLSKSITLAAKDVLTPLLAPHNKEIDLEFEESFKKEYKERKPFGVTEDEYVQNKINENADSIKAEKEARTRKGLDVIQMDISLFGLNLNTEKDIDSTFLNILSEKFDTVDSDVREYAMGKRNEIAVLVRDAKFAGKSNKEKFSFMLDETKDNQYYLTKYKGEFNDILENFDIQLNELDYGTKEHIKATKKKREWLKNNTNKGIPISKWLNPKYNSLSGKQKDFYDVFIKQLKQNDRMTNNLKSLLKQPIQDGPIFIKMHGVTQSNLDKILSGEMGNAIKTATGDLVRNRKDDEQYGNREEEDFNKLYEKTLTDLNNQPVNNIPIFYRNKIDAKDQSYDLGTMLLMDSVMSKGYEQKKTIEAEVDLLLDVIANSKVIKRNSFAKGFVNAMKKDHNITQSDLVKIGGIDSNLYKKMLSMTENRMYGITDKYSGKILNGKISINQLSNTVASFTADLQLGFNVLTAIPNVVQAKLQNMIEGVGGDIYTMKDILKADKIYWSDIKGIMDDVGSFVNTSKINILAETFDIMGDASAVKTAFENNHKLRSLGNRGAIHSFNAMGEHYAQSTLMIAIMTGIKVKNEKGQFINSEGNVVTKEKAMSLYDAYEKKTDANGMAKLELNKHAYSTSHSNQPLNKLGKIHHQQLIRKITIKLHGQYDTKFQSHLQRSWYGKLFMMFRKWMVSSYQRRYKGVMYSMKDKSELTREQKFFDFEMGRFDEGIYTSLFRFIKTGLLPSIKNMSLEIATQNFNEMSDMEKSNMRKVVAEVLITVMMATAAMLTYAAADGDDDETLFALAYIFRRQQSEFMQFYHPGENLRVFRSPAVALNTLEKTYSWASQIMPWAVTEEYENGKNRGEYKAWIKTKKLIPVIAQFERSPKELFNFLENTTN